MWASGLPGGVAFGLLPDWKQLMVKSIFGILIQEIHIFIRILWLLSTSRYTMNLLATRLCLKGVTSRWRSLPPERATSFAPPRGTVRMWADFVFIVFCFESLFLSDITDYVLLKCKALHSSLESNLRKNIELQVFFLKAHCFGLI